MKYVVKLVLLVSLISAQNVFARGCNNTSSMSGLVSEKASVQRKSGPAPDAIQRKSGPTPVAVHRGCNNTSSMSGLISEKTK